MDGLYLQECEIETGKKHTSDNPLLKSLKGHLLDVDNSFKSLSPQQISRLKIAFSNRAGSWLPVDRSGVWRYREFLPAFEPYYTTISLYEGNSPVYTMPQCAAFSGLETLLCKHAGLNPTGSIADHGMATAITMAKLLDAKAVGCASLGSSAVSMAAYAARAGLVSVAIVPARETSQNALAQILENRAITIIIDGDITQAQSIMEALCRQLGVYPVDSTNPFRIEGEKTALIELLHQLEWEVPDWIVIPDGTLATCRAFGKGLVELQTTGFISRLPRLAIIQSQDFHPLYDTLYPDKKIDPPNPALTRAQELGIAHPPHLDEAMRYIQLTNGVTEIASENSIAMAKNYIGRDGLCVDPSAAAALAGCKNLVANGAIQSNETIVCLFTGHLLNDPDYAYEYHTDALFTDTVHTVHRQGKARVPTFGIFNRPVFMPADQEKILKYVTEKITDWRFGFPGSHLSL